MVFIVVNRDAQSHINLRLVGLWRFKCHHLLLLKLLVFSCITAALWNILLRFGLIRKEKWPNTSIVLLATVGRELGVEELLSVHVPVDFSHVAVVFGCLAIAWEDSISHMCHDTSLLHVFVHGGVRPGTYTIFDALMVDVTVLSDSHGDYIRIELSIWLLMMIYRV